LNIHELEVNVTPGKDRAGTRTLDLDTGLTVSNVAVIRKTLLETLKKATHLEVRLSGNADVDVAGLQLLCSAHRTAVAKGKTIRLSGPDEASFREVIARSGFDRKMGCDGKTGCLWAGAD